MHSILRRGENQPEGEYQQIDGKEKGFISFSITTVAISPYHSVLHERLTWLLAED
jgi:hypothetical protein